MTDELVITGLGAVGPFGFSTDELWSALLRSEPTWRYGGRMGEHTSSGDIVDFDLNKFRRTANGHRLPRISQYALAAAAQAIAQSSLSAKGTEKDSISIVYGTGNGPSDVMEKNLRAFTTNLGSLEPLSFQESVFNAPASLISIEYGFRGPLLALPMGWAAGGYAIAMAADLISFGHADVVVVVTSDESACLGHQALSALQLVSSDRHGPAAIRPFDKRNSGSVLGEGAAALVLEKRSSASLNNH